MVVFFLDDSGYPPDGSGLMYRLSACFATLLRITKFKVDTQMMEVISHLNCETVPHELGIILLMPFPGQRPYGAPVKNGREVQDNIHDYILSPRLCTHSR